MTPQEFLKIQREQYAIIDAAEKIISKAHEKVQKAKPPINELRKATADDLTRTGKIVWHDNGDEGWFWNVVQEPNHYGDSFKAYVADDGCRYGLDGAWVYKSDPVAAPERVNEGEGKDC